MKAFLFAAGLGTRLQPYTFETPKPLLKIYDKPIIYYILKYLSKIGISEIWVNTCYLKEQFALLHSFESELNVKIHLIPQEDLYMHGGDLAFAQDFWKEIKTNETFIAINADTLFYINPDEINNLKSKVDTNNPLVVIGMQSERNPLKVSHNHLIGINKTFYNPQETNSENHTGDGFGVYLMHSSIKDYLCAPKEEMGFYDTDGIVGNIIKKGNTVLYFEPKDVKRTEIGNVNDFENYKENKVINDIIDLLER